MEFFVDVTRFLEETTLDPRVVSHIKNKYKDLIARKGIYSVNDTMGKDIASAVFGDLASAHFRRWIYANYEIGDCDY